jgi:CTP synthase (UTP-ammonia lyase)
VRSLDANVLIDLPADHAYFIATFSALRHASSYLGLTLETHVVRTDSIDDVDQIVRPGSAVVIGPGSPYRNQDAAHAVVRAARERGVPLVGT